jgi:hypothetical protein
MIRGSLVQVPERNQFFIGVRNETLSIVAMCVRNPDYRISVAAGASRGSLTDLRETVLRFLMLLLVLRVFDSQQTWLATL